MWILNCQKTMTSLFHRHFQDFAFKFTANNKSDTNQQSDKFCAHSFWRMSHNWRVNIPRTPMSTVSSWRLSLGGPTKICLYVDEFPLFYVGRYVINNGSLDNNRSYVLAYLVFQLLRWWLTPIKNIVSSRKVYWNTVNWCAHPNNIRHNGANFKYIQIHTKKIPNKHISMLEDILATSTRGVWLCVCVQQFIS